MRRLGTSVAILGMAADLARFGGALLSGKIVGPDILPLLLSSRRTNNGAETGCGFGFRIAADGSVITCLTCDGNYRQWVEIALSSMTFFRSPRSAD